MPSWPSDTRWSGAAGRTRGRGLEIGERFFLERDDGDVVTRRRGRRRARENGNRPLPAIRPQAHARVRAYSSASTSSARRVARRRITPRSDVRMKSTTNCTSAQASVRSRSIWRSALVVFSFDCSR